MIRPCPNPECSKPVIVPLDVLAEAMSGGGKQLTCSRCGDVLWLSKDGVLKSVSEEYRGIKQREEVIKMAEKEPEQKKQEKCNRCGEIKEIAIDETYVGGKTCHDCLKNICIKADVHTGVCEPFTTTSQ